MNDTYKEQSNFKILVRIQGNTEEIKLVDSDAFVVYFRGKDQQYFIYQEWTRSQRNLEFYDSWDDKWKKPHVCNKFTKNITILVYQQSSINRRILVIRCTV
jgi:hypothetical protein